MLQLMELVGLTLMCKPWLLLMLPKTRARGDASREGSLTAAMGDAPMGETVSSFAKRSRGF